MAVAVLPTLAPMAEVYALSRQGGAESPLFRDYVRRITKGAPLQPYNPMAGAVTLPTVEALLALDAEHVLAEVAREVLDGLGWTQDVVLCLGVSHPGVWTERVTTEAEHRLRPRLPKGPEIVLLWAGEPIDAATLRVETAAQAARAVWRGRHGPVRTVRDAFRQEGWVYATAGASVAAVPAEVERVVFEVLRVVGDDEGLDRAVALLYGDDAARRLGWVTLGVPDRAGYAVALQDALRAQGHPAV